jgi:hypothetical protein
VKLKRLPIRVDKRNLKQLMKSKIPAYLVGVHEPTKRTFLITPRKVKRIDNIATTHSMDNPAVLKRLRQEVEDFWRGVSSPFLATQSFFVD